MSTNIDNIMSIPTAPFLGGTGWDTEPVSEANDMIKQIVIGHTNAEKKEKLAPQRASLLYPDK